MPDIAILDTNVVLDWLVFRDRRVQPLVEAIVAGRLTWVATPAMRTEFDLVMERGFGPGRPVDVDAGRAAWSRHCRSVADPLGPTPPTHPRCRDPSDQMYVELALRLPARWLLSRDRALLALRTRLARHGVGVVVPEHAHA